MIFDKEKLISQIGQRKLVIKGVPIDFKTLYRLNNSTIIFYEQVDIDTIPIPKSSSKKRIEQNINIFNFKLTPEEIATIDKFDCGGRIVQFEQYT